MNVFPESLTRRCFRCKNAIMWADRDERATIQGRAVLMHVSCKEKHDKEEADGVTSQDSMPEMHQDSS